MLTINTQITAGHTIKFVDQGNFLRVMSAAAALTVRTYKNGQVLTESVGVGAGYAEEFSDNFNEVEIYSATTQTIQLVLRLGSKVYFDAPPTGNVNITNVNGVFTQSRASVSNTNTQILAANANRRYLLIQNNDTLQALRITLDNSAATITQGFRLEPGASIDLSNFCTSSAVNVIFEAATALANNVEYVTG